MKPIIVLIAIAMTIAQFSLASAEDVINTNDTANAPNTGEPSIAPDSVFWGLKNALDKVSLALTFNPQSKAEKGLRIAEERLREFRKMAEKGDVRAAEKAKLSYDDYVRKAKTAADEIDDDNKTVEIEKQIRIQKRVEEFEGVFENESTSLKVKIHTKGNLTAEQKALIDSLIQSMQNQTGALKVQIEQNKEKIKIQIKQRTGKSDIEIEKEIEAIENKTHLSTIRKEKAFEEIEDAKEEIAKLVDDVSANNITDQSVLTLLNNSREKLSKAQDALNATKFGEAYGLANAAQHLAENAREKIEKFAEKQHDEIDRKNETQLCESNGGSWTQFPNDGKYCHDECDKPTNVKCLKALSMGCDCGTEKCWNGKKCIDEIDDNRKGRICIQVITPAKNEKTGECKEFPTPCDVPKGWENVNSCINQGSNTTNSSNQTG